MRFSPTTSSAYSAPTFSAIARASENAANLQAQGAAAQARAMQGFSQNIGQGFAERRQKREAEQQRLAEEQRQADAMRSIYEAYSSPGDYGSRADAVMAAMFTTPGVDPAMAQFAIGRLDKDAERQRAAAAAAAAAARPDIAITELQGRKARVDKRTGQFLGWVLDDETYGSMQTPEVEDVSESYRQVIGPDGTFVGSFPANDPRLAQYSGNPDYRIASVSGTDLNALKGAQTGIVEDQVLAAEQAQAWAGISSQMDQNLDSLTNLSRLTIMGLSMAERAGINIGDRNEARLIAESRLKADIQAELVTFINAMSGAAVSPSEREALLKAMPNMDDSPSEFIGKLQSLSGRIERTLGIDVKNPTAAPSIPEIDPAAQPEPILNPIQEAASAAVQNVANAVAPTAEAADAPPATPASPPPPPTEPPVEEPELTEITDANELSLGQIETLLASPNLDKEAKDILREIKRLKEGIEERKTSAQNAIQQTRENFDRILGGNTGGRSRRRNR